MSLKVEGKGAVDSALKLPVGVRVTCPSCSTKLVFAKIDDNPVDEIVINLDCPECGESLPLPVNRAL